MLNELRKPGRAKSIVAWILFSAIILVFVFFGVTPDGGGLQRGGPAAVVNSKPISIADFIQTHDRIREQMQFDLNQLPAQQRQQIEMNTRRRALETLISREVVAQAALNKGLIISKDQLASYIRSVPQFQENGVFKRDLYLAYLDSIRKTPADFEQTLQRDIVVNEIQNLFTSGLAPVKGEATYQAKLAKTKLNLGVIRFSVEELEESIPVPAARVSAFLAEAKNQEVVKSYYNTNIADYQTAEQVKARHILILADPKDTKATDEARNKMTAIQERLKKEDFAKVAQAESQDPQSAKNGGDLGFFGRGRMVPEFEQAVFALKPGETSGVVQTQYGFHIIRLDEKKEATTTPLEKAQNGIAKKLLAKEEVEKTIADLNKALQEKNTSSVEAQLKALNLKWEETGEFPMSQATLPVIGDDEKIVTEAFQLTGAGQMPNRVLTSDGEYFMLKMLSVKVANNNDINDEDLEREEVMSQQRAGDAFNRWIGEQRNLAKIKRNESLFSVQ